MKYYRMQDLTVRELQEYLKTNQTVILPYALCEQHGFHLPLDTDIQTRRAAIAAAQPSPTSRLSLPSL